MMTGMRDYKTLRERRTAKMQMATLMLAVTVTTLGCAKSQTEESRANMIYIAGGSFDGHEIAPFYLDETEVTVAAFRDWWRGSRWMGCESSDESAREDAPIRIHWDCAKAYCEWRGARIPTEWEWEWAARGREDAREFPWGSDEPSCAYAVIEIGCDEDRVWPVGSKPAGNSRDGLKDMAGNAAEWTSGVEGVDGEVRVLRGGSYRSNSGLLYQTRARSRFPVSSEDAFGGIRCAKSDE